MEAANVITKSLANLGGGAIKDGGGGMQKGLEILCKTNFNSGFKTGATRTLGIVAVVVGGFLIGKSLIEEHINNKRNERFEEYHNLLFIENVTSIQEISKTTQKSSEIVKKEIQKLIDKGFLLNAKIDTQSDKIIIE